MTGITSVIMIMIAINPKPYIDSVLDSLSIFAVYIFPNLFPFFFFSKVLILQILANDLSQSKKRRRLNIFNAPRIGYSIFAIALISGYPTGAKLISDCYDQKLLDTSRAESIIPFTSTASPLFILGTIGTAHFNNRYIGIALLISHYIGAILNGVLFGKSAILNEHREERPLIIKNQFKAPQISETLTNAVSSSTTSILIVGAYIIIFNVIITLLNSLSIISGISSVLRLFKVPNEISSAIITSIIEPTRGIIIISKLNYDPKIILPILSVMLAFGGMSIALQSMAFLIKCKIKFRKYLITKVWQSILSFSVTLVICQIFF